LVPGLSSADQIVPYGVLFTFLLSDGPGVLRPLPVKLFHGQPGDEMMLLCGLATKKTPDSSDPMSSLLHIGGNRPQHQEFESRTMWSLSNAFTSAFKELDPIPQFRATARLGRFLETANAAY
jgi:hypothetical protein